jgi:glycosyltransferase involved in cell wall biosynthesis
VGLALACQDRLRESIEHFVRARTLEPTNPGFQETLFPILVTLLQEEPAPPPQWVPPPLEPRPLVSVIIPTRDRPALLPRALASLERQTYQPWEAVVVNDAQGRGPAAARNEGVERARGSVLAFLDDDDLYAAQHLEGLVEALRASTAALAYADVELVEETLGQVEVGRKPFLPGLRYSRALLLVRNYIPINGWALRRECFDHFNEELGYLEDWDFLLRLSRRAAIHHIEATTAEYRVTQGAADSISKRHQHRPAVEAMYRRHEAGGLAALARELYLETL